MNKKVQRYFEVVREMEGVRNLRETLANRFGVDLWQSYEKDDPRFEEVNRWCGRLIRLEQSLQPYVMRANLGELGIKNLRRVEGVVYNSANVFINGRTYFRRGEEAGRLRATVPELCALGNYGVARKLGLDTTDMKISSGIEVRRDGKSLGRIESNGVFEYHEAPDIRTALGWLVATGIGRSKIIDQKIFDLDRAAARLLEVVSQNGRTEHCFYNVFLPCLKHMFNPERGVGTCGDSYCIVAHVLWEVTTREIYGEPHPGYSLMF